jgi:Putative auto-transporter adhesin, head GIN domain
MKIRALALILLAVSLLVTSGCYISTDGVSWIWNADAIEGSGVIARESRPIGEFRRIEVQGSFDVKCSVGAEPQVTITGDDNLLPHVITELNGDTLVLRMERGRYSCHSSLHATVSTPTLEGVEVCGSGDVDVIGLQGARFEASISGSGSITADGEVQHLEASISGSGDLELSHLRAETGDVTISGSGDADIHVTDQLRATVSGSGDIHYRGDPKATLHISGSGSIEPKT